MFERKFEFTVHQPLEVCEERILNLRKPSCFPPVLNTIDSSAISERYRGYSEIYLSQQFGFTKGNRVNIKMTIEQIDQKESHISGLASSRTPFGHLVFFLLLTNCAIIYWRAWNVVIPVTVFLTILNFLLALQTVYIRNRLISTIEQVLNQV